MQGRRFMMAYTAANRGPAAHRDRSQAGSPGQSEPGGRQTPSPQPREDKQAPPDDGLSSSFAFLLDKLHDAAAARDRD
jgi:hypothetical protein